MTAATLVILTGASRGLGEAMAAHYLAGGAFVLGLSRGQSAALKASGAGGLAQWPVDLSDPLPVAGRLAAWLADFERRAAGALPGRLRVIHNAALLSAPGNVAEADPADLARSLRIGIEAPVALTAAFLRATAHWAASDRRVLFVSSGLGRRPMAGSAAYCAQKAGLDHFARALALEEQARPHGARVASVAPGIIDTDMQKQLRGADPQRFPEAAKFDEFHRSGSLDSPATAAAKVIALLERDDYGSNPVTDVRG
ncbi:SDR family NAD(P)-dependent oxidoreductase [Scleromatobacter humisilvae]|uniref:SDR family NAD(P)-dependent oxidoreductase n=1 Tax=Scleromatobacter humisilvae TaxID=2897159 RepID=A0A9X1YK74_9BURK|nr:SDR family NAD(P)-dependent oxidoreductase [Scleromatobacter humisilvae]MCK9687713.1 SDR family NAD(P)-dependent oxidoreductase [Scleromatobacter humisilvae]